MKSNLVSPWGEAFLVFLSALLILLILLPIAAIISEAFEIDLVASLGSQHGRNAVKVSLLTSGISTVLALILGTPLAFLMAKVEFRGRSILEVLVDLPIVLPPSVAGLGLLLVFGRQGWLGDSLQVLGISLPFSTAAVILAQLFVSSPLFVRSARIGFGAIDDSLIESAYTEGATRFQLLQQIMIPAAIPALVSGALLTWARALGEFGATILFAGNLSGITQTMPLAIYVGLEGNREEAIALSLLLLVIAASFLLLIRRFEQRWQI